jgi:LacI family transcriptional regulator
MKRPTINDVAAHAGVSRATVSLVVRDSHQISDVTKARVRESMAAIGYVYNRRAAEMRSLSSRILGLVVSNVRNPYFAELTMAVEEAAGAQGYTVLLGCSSDDVARQERLLRAMVEHRVDGLILLPASHSTTADLAAVLGKDVPHVLVTRSLPGHVSDYVGADNVASGELIGRHLRELGARSVAFVGGVEHSVPRDDRRAGVLRGLGKDVRRFVADVTSAYDTGEGMPPLLERALAGPAPEAIVAYNDMYAFALLGALRAHGLEPGRDVAVASFDDVPETQRTYPSLTSAAGHPELVGARATELLLRAVEGGPHQPERVLIEPELSIRDSTLSWAAARQGLPA